MMEQECLFCKIVNKKIPSTIVYEDNDVLAFEDINPQAPVHIIIIPKKHIERVSDLKQEDALLMSKVVLSGNKIAAERGLSQSGYRYVINCNKDAGQVIFHLHMHLLGGRKMNWPPG